MIKIDIYFDGACKNVKGSREELYGVGVAVFIDGVFEREFSVALPGKHGTSNLAEWSGCVQSMYIGVELSKLVEQLGETAIIRVYSDSQVITNQFNGMYSINTPSFIEYFEEARAQASLFGLKSIIWVPREKNTEADILSKEGLEEARKRWLT